MQDKNKELGVREERSVQALLDHLEAAWGIIANSEELERAERIYEHVKKNMAAAASDKAAHG